MLQLVIITLLLCCLITLCPCFSRSAKWPYPYPPSLAPNSGPYPTAVDMSSPTLQSITTHLAVTLGVIKSSKDYNHKTFKTIDSEMKEKLRGILGDATMKCGVVLKPNGQISSLSIWKSSAPRDKELEVCELIRNSGPFEKNDYPDKLLYSITFPDCERKLVYSSDQLDINSKQYREEPQPN